LGRQLKKCIVTERSVTLQRGLFHNRNTAGFSAFLQVFNCLSGSVTLVIKSHSLKFAMCSLAQKCYMLLTYETNPMNLRSWLQ